MPQIKTVKYEARFCKKGMMVYISHLDLMTLFRRAIRRAGLPFVVTGGFTPRVKISIPSALKLGRESGNEKMTLWLTDDIDPKELLKEINGQLPEGIRIVEIQRA
ncbi:MAG: TIGR03936 family radical SAM-associated protein [Candidatus Omnitrophota bacterium]|nr:TIGR03936 family radical SAM-associated protein [Candidatus Omnitrophota bacterium]